MEYKTIIPATGWFFVHANSGTPKKFTVHRLAAWALTGAGEVIGLLPVTAPVETNKTNAKLVSPPPIPGAYVHESDLTADMRDCM